MSETITATTSNGEIISHPRETLRQPELVDMLKSYGLEGNNPAERANGLRHMSKETMAAFLADLNGRLNGSEETLINDRTTKIGEKATIAPEDRYDLFSRIVEKIQSSSEAINPARLGDVVALSTVLLHPFVDGNGRTARTIGYIFREGLDEADAVQDFDQLTESRDTARERGGFMINGYIPYLGEGVDQSDPQEVEQYIDKLLTSEDPHLYTGPYGQAELMAHVDTQATQAQ